MKKILWCIRLCVCCALVLILSALANGCAERPAVDGEKIVALTREIATITGGDASSIAVDMDADGDGKVTLTEAVAARRWISRSLREQPPIDNSAWIRQWNLCAETCRQIGLDMNSAHTAAVLALQHAGKMRDEASSPAPASFVLPNALDLRRQQSGNGDSTTTTKPKPTFDGGTSNAAGASPSNQKGSATAATENRASQAFSENK